MIVNQVSWKYTYACLQQIFTEAEMEQRQGYDHTSMHSDTDS